MNRISDLMEPSDCLVGPGVQLFLGAADDCTDRVQLNSGTIAAPTATTGEAYEDDAIIPRAGWRDPTVADRKTLIAESCPSFSGNAISVLRLPSELLDPFRPLRIAAAKYRSREMFLPIIGSEDCSRATDAVIAYLQDRLAEKGTHPLGGLQIDRWISTRPPGLQTLTVNPATHARVGLHIDSWDEHDLELGRREYSPNRVCINLGSEDRFFVYLNTPIGQMYKAVKRKSKSSICDYGPSAIATEFMRSFPSHPVVRLRLRPGEAYVAPTENIVHDGSSIDMNAMDVALLIRGRFSLLPG